MAKKSRGFNITTEDIVFAGIGGVIGLAVNPLVNRAVAGQSEEVRNAVGTALPVAKVAGGGYVAMSKQRSRKMRMMGIGLAAEGGVELGLRFIPEKYVSIAGVQNGDVFSTINGTTAIEIPVNPSAGANLPAAGFEQEAILGTQELVEQAMPIL